MSKQKTIHLSKCIDEIDANQLFEFLLKNVDWGDGITTKTGQLTRKQGIVTDELMFDMLSQIIQNSLEKLGIDDLPFFGIGTESIYLNYYRDGNDYTPSHRHSDSRQLVISLGATRALKVGTKMYNLENGDVIFFGSSAHSVPKDESVTTARISVAVFLPR
jgi:alkylated DNA repair dioxygenase AlkB